MLLSALLSSVLPRRRRVPEGARPGEPAQVLLELLPEGAELLGHRTAAAVVGLGRARPAPPAASAINGSLHVGLSEKVLLRDSKSQINRFTCSGLPG